MSDDSGPASPAVAITSDDSLIGDAGMSLRDYFAGQAMAAMISTSAAPAIVGGLAGAESNCAASAYMMADAMIKERDADI